MHFRVLRPSRVRSITQVLQVIAARPKAIPSPAPVFKLLDAPFAPPVLQAHASIVHLLVHPTSPPPLLGGLVTPVHAQTTLLVRESINQNESGACFGGGSGLPFGCHHKLQPHVRAHKCERKHQRQVPGCAPNTPCISRSPLNPHCPLSKASCGYACNTVDQCASTCNTGHTCTPAPVLHTFDLPTLPKVLDAHAVAAIFRIHHVPIRTKL